MDHVAKEYKPPVWKIGLAALSLLTVAGLAVLWQVDDPIWGNSLRLLTFMLFAGAVVCGLKVMEGTYTVRLERRDDRIVIIFFKGAQRLEEESFPLATLLAVEKEHLRRGVPGIYLWEEVYLTGRFRQKDQEVHLFHYGGRPLCFDPVTAEGIRDFLREATGG